MLSPLAVGFPWQHCFYFAQQLEHLIESPVHLKQTYRKKKKRMLILRKTAEIFQMGKGKKKLQMNLEVDENIKGQKKVITCVYEKR